MALLLASNNPGKLRELHALLPGAAIATPAEIELALDVAETGTTFAANAALKARAFAKASGHITLADDSGLEVDALNGAPGVYSARYGGPGLDDEGRYRRLLAELKPFPQSAQRSARFRCAIFACAPTAATACPRALAKVRSPTSRPATTVSATTRSSTSPPKKRPWPSSPQR